MQTEPQITFRDIPRSEAIENHILENIEQLEQISDKIIACRVVVEQSQKKQHQGKIFNVKIITNIAPNEDPIILAAMPSPISSNKGVNPIETANAIITKANNVSQPCLCVWFIFFFIFCWSYFLFKKLCVNLIL